MNSKTFLFAILMAASPSWLVGQTAAQPARGPEFVSEVELPEKNLKLEGRLYSPTSATPVRGAVVFMAVNDLPNHDSEWQSFAAQAKCALIGVRLTFIGGRQKIHRWPTSSGEMRPPAVRTACLRSSVVWLRSQVSPS